MRHAGRRIVLAALLALAPLVGAAAERLRPVIPGTPPGDALVERLRGGGLVLFVRHADTIGMPCDRTFRVGDRDGQRNLSARGRGQAVRIGTALRDLATSQKVVFLTIPADIVAKINDPAFQVGVIPGHRRSDSLAYDTLFDEAMLLYCGADHALFAADDTAMDWDTLVSHRFAGLGYHSPNMEISQQMRLARQATAFDQEAIATLILSGRFLGFLPDHYAEAFVRQGRMRAVQPRRLHYECEFVSVLRRSPRPPRAALAFHRALLRAHPVEP